MHLPRFRECYKILPSEQNLELEQRRNSTDLLPKNKEIETKMNLLKFKIYLPLF
jgi:hypothetical protein